MIVAGHTLYPATALQLSNTNSTKNRE